MMIDFSNIKNNIERIDLYTFDDIVTYLEMEEVIWFDLEDGYGFFLLEDNLVSLEIINTVSGETVKFHNSLEQLKPFYEQIESDFFVIPGYQLQRKYYH